MVEEPEGTNGNVAAPLATDPLLMRILAGSSLADRFILAKQLGYTFGGKRKMYQVLGYDETITWRQYRDRYARGGIAGRVVDALAKTVWRGVGVVYEDEDPKTDTDFEKAWKALNERLSVWALLGRAHILSRLGSFSVLLLGVPGELDTPLQKGKPEDLLYITPFSGGVIDTSIQRGQSTSGIGADVDVKEWDQDPKSPRFGQPLTYQLRRTNITTPELQRPVHWSRLIHVAAPGFLDDAIFGPPGLESTWNYLDDLDKVVGGGSEAFWLRANAGIQFDIDKKTTIPSDPKDAAAELDRLKEQAEAYEHQMSRQIRTRGVNINQLGSDVADFSSPADILLTLIAGTTGIPKRILTGSEMGELASSQDRDNWNDQVKDCRDAYAKPIILRQFITRLIEYGYLPKPAQWDVEWPDIEAMSEDEKLDTAKKAQALNAGGEIVITGAELRETYLDLEPLGDDDLQVESWRAELALKMATVNKTQGAVVITDDQIREICWGWDPLKPEEKIPLTAPERVSATAPTPGVDAPAGPRAVPPQLRAAELGKTLRALEDAIESDDLEAIGKILALGDVSGHDFHGNQWSHGGGGRKQKEEMFLSAPRDAYDSIAAGEHATVVAADVRGVLKHATESAEGGVDLTKLTIEGTPIFAGGLNRARDTMPQIPKEHQKAFLQNLADKKIGVKEEDVSPSRLRPTQNEIEAGRVGQKLQDYDSGNKDLRPIMVSKDNYVLDGHHRWAVMATVDAENPSLRVKMPVIRIMQDHGQALRSMERYTKANKIANRALAAGVDIDDPPELLALGDKPGHEFHGNQWKGGVSSSHIEKLATGGSFKQTFANESKVVNALHDVNDAMKKAGWLNNDWTPGEGGSDTGHGASYQYEKKGMTAIVTRHHLALHLGSHRTSDD